MWRKAVPVLVIVAVVGGILFALLWPAMEREMMAGPVVEAIAAVRAGDMARLRGAFTDDAEVAHGGRRLPIDAALVIAEPVLLGYHGGGARFGGYTNLRRLSRDAVEADCTVWVSLEGGELPYRRAVVRKMGHVRLRREGRLRWKISYLASEEAEFGEAVRGGQ